jgi:predicted nucleic acid-binding protein
MQKLFVDTAAWIALEVINDERHEAAERFRREQGRAYQWITSNWVIWETVTWLRRRASHVAAVHFGERVLAADRIEIVTVSARVEASAWAIFKRYRDKDFGFIDCTSFAVMESLETAMAFTFDDHFRQAGYRMLPDLS